MHVLRTIFDWIFPPSEELTRVRTLTKEQVLSVYWPHTIESTHVLASFSHPNIRALIHEAKFHQNARACELLAMLVDRFLTETSERFDLIVPVPLSKKRLRDRGHNQVVSILKCAPSAPPINTVLLIRKRHTVPQTELKREKRLKNMRDAFGVAHPEHIRDKHILLVDDVTTTGATLMAAKAALLPHSPSKVTCLALAH